MIPISNNEDYVEGFTEGVAAERERIIKLLDEHYDTTNEECSRPYSKPMYPEDMAYLSAIETAIALIKGEEQ